MSRPRKSDFDKAIESVAILSDEEIVRIHAALSLLILAKKPRPSLRKKTRAGPLLDEVQS